MGLRDFNGVLLPPIASELSMTLPPADRDGLTVEEYKELTSISESTIRRRIKDGTLPSWQPGGPGTRVLLPVSSLPSHQSLVTQSEPPGKQSPKPQATANISRLPGPKPRWKRTS